MPAEAVIRTGIDQLSELINAKNKISVQDAAKQLKVSTQTIEDWAALLDEAGAITIEYQLSKTYLVKKNIVPTEQKKNLNALTLEKREFEDRSGSMLSYLDRLADEVDALKGFVNNAKLQKLVPEELRKLKLAETENQQSGEQLMGLKESMLKKLRAMNAHITQEEAALKPVYDRLINEAGRVDLILDLESREAGLLDENRRVLEKKLGKVAQLLDHRVRHLIARKTPLVGKARQELQQLKKRVAAFKTELLKDRKNYADAVREHDARNAEIERLHKKIVSALQEHASKTYGKSPQQVQKFLRARAGVASVLSKLFAAQHEMKKTLLIIMGKGKSLALTDQTRFEDELSRLNKDLAALSKRRDDIEKDIKQLVERLK